MTFDSYPKENGEHYSEYGADHAVKLIEYDGVTMNHVLASMSTHQRYEYPHEEVGQETRYFWDGAYLSNTPLREVLQYHKDYWHKVTDLTEMLSTLKCVHSEPLSCNRKEASAGS